MKTQALECVGGWLVAYSPQGQWVSAITYPTSVTGCMWMVPGWNGD
jgi:hypothetical protein